MNSVLISVVAGLPYFITYILIAILIVLLGTSLYLFLTPHREIELIKKNNIAASISLSGTIIGITIPVAFCLATSVNYYDLAIWGTVGIIFQILLFFIMDKILKDLPSKIEKNQVGPAVLYFASKLSFSFLVAAAITG